jgi:hypothetical protein
MQGIGSVNTAVLANALRLAAGSLGALAAVTLLGAGPLGMFLAVAAAFVVNAAINVHAFASLQNHAIQDAGISMRRNSGVA